MKTIFWLCAALVCSVGIVAPAEELPAPSSATLVDCYQRALRLSETLAISEEEIRVVEGRYQQLRAAILPDIGWTLNHTRQDTVPASDGSVGSTLTQKERTESYFRASQPIFNGFREWNAMKAGRAELGAARWDRDQAARLLLAEVADVFVVASIAERDIAIFEESRRVTRERIEELERRVRLGKSRESEVLSTQVQLATLEAQIADRRGVRERARDILKFLTGLPSSTALLPPQRPPMTFPLESSLAKAAQRPDARAAEDRLQSAVYRVRYARGGYWPDIDVEGRYFTKRPGFQSEIDWDVLFTVDVPIFQGGLVRGAVREARSRHLQASLALARLRRQIEREVRTAHSDLAIALNQYGAFQKAVMLAEKNYAIQQQEYRLGLITNLEMLRLLVDTQDLKAEEARALATAYLDEVQLRVATGEGL